MFYSQQGEDSLIFNKYLSHREGFFIELGAMDGVCYSNSLFFEAQLGWKGILIEPTQDQYNRLIQNRPSAHCFNYAISDKEGEVEFIGSGALGGMTHTMLDSHRYGWKLDESHSAYRVKSVPIRNLVSEAGFERVDFFSIDVEGGEFEVLNTFDWNIPVYLILIEGEYKENPNMQGWDEKTIERYHSCRNILIENGFQYMEDIGCNEIWINPANSPKI